MHCTAKPYKIKRQDTQVSQHVESSIRAIYSYRKSLAMKPTSQGFGNGCDGGKGEAMDKQNPVPELLGNDDIE